MKINMVKKLYTRYIFFIFIIIFVFFEYLIDQLSSQLWYHILQILFPSFFKFFQHIIRECEASLKSLWKTSHSVISWWIINILPSRLMDYTPSLLTKMWWNYNIPVILFANATKNIGPYLQMEFFIKLMIFYQNL